MTLRPFRFGVVAAVNPELGPFTELARRAESLGYHTLLVPDPVDGLDPLTVLPAGLAVTSELRFGTFVLTNAFRDRYQLDWQARSLHAMSGGRFELGLGTGRPGAEIVAAGLKRPFGTGSQRLADLAATVDQMTSARDRPPLLISGAGPKVLDLAARKADIISLALPPLSDANVARSLVELVRGSAGDRFGDIELGLNLLAIGAEPTPWMRQALGVDAPNLAAAGAVTVLPGDPAEAADVLRSRRETLGVSYVKINAAALDAFAPVVAELRGT
ncbi:LLM class flavin-dependent oxidoreductase [Amycolatopsis thailandensis]|uniref:LLM class flavin-dependent oxidoreductase n=1 Tax=Amycolatopsis thailandensis TaxID=589330 RepID=UPI0037A14F75